MEEEIEKIEEKEVKVFKEMLEWCFCIFLALVIAMYKIWYVAQSEIRNSLNFA